MLMTAKEWRAGLKELDLTQVGAAKVFGCSRRAAQYWAADGPSPMASFAMRLLLAIPASKRRPWLHPWYTAEED